MVADEELSQWRAPGPIRPPGFARARGDHLLGMNRKPPMCELDGGATGCARGPRPQPLPSTHPAARFAREFHDQRLTRPPPPHPAPYAAVVRLDEPLWLRGPNTRKLARLCVRVTLACERAARHPPHPPSTGPPACASTTPSRRCAIRASPRCRPSAIPDSSPCSLILKVSRRRARGTSSTAADTPRLGILRAISPRRCRSDACRRNWRRTVAAPKTPNTSRIRSRCCISARMQRAGRARRCGGGSRSGSRR